MEVAKVKGKAKEVKVGRPILSGRAQNVLLVASLILYLTGSSFVEIVAVPGTNAKTSMQQTL